MQHLLSPAVAALTAAEAEAAEVKATPDKKRRKGSAKGGGRSDSGATAAVDPAAAMWAMRLEVVGALHKCFLYDTAVERFVDTERFEQVMPALVQQLEELPELLDESDGEGEGAGAGVGGGVGQAVEAAVSSCAVQLAVAAGTDTLWRPLSRAVLMCTRSTRVRTRLAALAVIRALAARLREEYLVLLPETLPFLAELMEDPVEAVEAACQATLAELAELSGENLHEMLS